MDIMSELEHIGGLVRDELRAALRRGWSPPSSRQLIADAGGASGLARRELGYQGRRLPGKGTPERLAYDAERQRWQRRAKAGELPADVRRSMLRRARAAFDLGRRAALTRGTRTRVEVELRIPSPMAQTHGAVDRRERQIPAGGPGVLLASSWSAAMLEAFDAGELEELGAAFASGLAYGDDGTSWSFLEDPDEYTLASVKLWPDGDSEPA